MKGANTVEAYLGKDGKLYYRYRCADCGRYVPMDLRDRGPCPRGGVMCLA